MRILVVIFLFTIFTVNILIPQEKVTSLIEKEQLLESVGILSSSNLYLTYLSIQLIYNTLNDTTQAERLMGILSPMKNTLLMINEHIKKLADIKNLSKEDIKVIKGIGKACELLLEDSELLDIYMKDRDAKSKEQFLEKHKKTGDYLKELFKNEL